MDKFEQWQQTGGTLRVVELSDHHAVVDLCSCTGELMERCSTDDPAVLSRLQTAVPTHDSDYQVAARRRISRRLPS